MVKTHKNTQIKSQQCHSPKNQSNDSKDDLKSCKYKGGTDNQNVAAQMKKIQEMFNKDREETKNRQSSMNNT